jgi:peptide-methionine (R)-S-oxide reductase
MKAIKNPWIPWVLLAFLLSCAGRSDDAEPETRGGTTVEDTLMPTKIQKTDEEWKKELSPETYHVMREQGTELPFTGKYYDHHEKGIYRCAACSNPLFSSDAKFESGSGWPSFYETLTDHSVETQPDHSGGMIRTEVHCWRCGGHLGHLFDDGPKPTGLRYCINSVALTFEEE